MGGAKGKMWTYLIMMAVLITVVIVINLVWKNPEAAKSGFNSFLGLPAWALVVVTFLVGAIIFWIGLKIETDWPEAFGAVLIAASVFALEKMIGWQTFELGGLLVMPYLIPLLVFVVLLMYGMKKSV